MFVELSIVQSGLHMMQLIRDEINNIRAEIHL